MTLKEELEILRGAPIKVFDGDPLSIPCIETSDVVQLCKHPVVSVHMLTYNHEPYIRQAIEGVMAQKTDFEFELVIGEDFSKDKTREICFEYQKKYPDKIRVLWWHENVSKYGGNLRRITAHCRGEFIAFCEGDDYWIDPLKLQKQVEVMRKNPNLGFCFTNARILQHDSGVFSDWMGAKCYIPGVISGERFFSMYSYGIDPGHGQIDSSGLFIMTASCLLRKILWCELQSRYEIFSWQLLLGDKQLWLGLATLSDVYYIGDKTTVYRKNNGSAMARNARNIYRDSAIAKIFLAIEGPYKYDLPFPVIESAFFMRGSQFSIPETAIMIQELLHRHTVSFAGVSLGTQIKWALFFKFKRKWVFQLRWPLLFTLRRFCRFLQHLHEHGIGFAFGKLKRQILRQGEYAKVGGTK